MFYIIASLYTAFQSLVVTQEFLNVPFEVLIVHRSQVMQTKISTALVAISRHTFLSWHGLRGLVIVMPLTKFPLAPFPRKLILLCLQCLHTFWCFPQGSLVRGRSITSLAIHCSRDISPCISLQTFFNYKNSEPILILLIIESKIPKKIVIISDEFFLYFTLL